MIITNILRLFGRRSSLAFENEKKNARKLERTIKSCALVALAALLTFSPVSALTPEELDFFAENNIVFYDPDGTGGKKFCNTSSGDCNIIGNTKDEKLWSGLRHIGFTPLETAAIMGNMAHEGGSPTTQEYAYTLARNSGCTTQEGYAYTIWLTGGTHGSCMAKITGGSYYSAGSYVAGIGLGFVQWTSQGRREGYLESMRSLNLLQYFDEDAYKVYGSLSDNQLYDKIVEETGSDADYWALWCAAIKFVKIEMDGDYSDFYLEKNQTSIQTLAGWVAADYERCSSCKAGQSSYNARVASAVKYYEQYEKGDFDFIESGDGGESSTQPSSGENGANVTIIGDSLTDGARNNILKLLPEADIHAQHSKFFATDSGSNLAGTTIAKQLKDSGTLRSTVVFALGTNNKGGIGDSVINNLVENIIGSGHTIYFLTNYDDVKPDIYNSNNAELTAAAATYANVRLIDWKGIVEKAKEENPGVSLIQNEWSADGSSGYAVHPTPEGNELFAKTLYDGLTGAGGNANNCENITDPNQAISYMQQFIVDTNYLYGTRYTVPQTGVFDTALGTPDDDSAVSAKSSVQSSWIEKGLITAEEGLGGCWRATYCGQCTALSGWFVAMMTEYVYGGGNGGEVVANMLVTPSNSDLVVSDVPTPFSVFSESGSSSAGHTGIVIGELDDGSYLTIENNMNAHELMIRVRTNFASKNATFLDLSAKLKLHHLGETYE